MKAWAWIFPDAWAPGFYRDIPEQASRIYALLGVNSPCEACTPFDVCAQFDAHAHGDSGDDKAHNTHRKPHTYRVAKASTTPDKNPNTKVRHKRCN